MDKARKRILVIGATGQQGGAVVRRLFKKGWSVKALVRDPNKPAALALVQQGVEIVKGDMEDRVSLDHAMKGMYGVFSVQQFWGLGAEGEIRQGKNVADAAKVAGVQHVVYSSVGGAERKTGLSHFESKWQIEEYIRTLGLPATILRPVFFMDNLQAYGAPTPVDGVLTFSTPLTRETKLQMIAVDDIGAFAAMAFERPQEYIGKAIELAGDELSFTTVAELYTKVTGKQHRFVEQSMEVAREFSAEAADMYEWFNREGYRADIPALRNIHSELLTMEAWLRRSKNVNNKKSAAA